MYSPGAQTRQGTQLCLSQGGRKLHSFLHYFEPSCSDHPYNAKLRFHKVSKSRPVSPWCALQSSANRRGEASKGIMEPLYTWIGHCARHLSFKSALTAYLLPVKLPAAADTRD